MAGPNPTPNPGPQAGAANPAQQASNPLAGTPYADLVDQIRELNKEFAAGSVEIAEYRAKQANLIDPYKSLAAQMIKQSALQQELRLKIKSLGESTDAASRSGALYRSQMSLLIGQYLVARTNAADTAKTVRILSDELALLNKQAAASEKKQAAVEAEKENRLTGAEKMAKEKAQAVGGAMLKGAGAMGDFSKYATLLAAKTFPAFGAALGTVSKVLGGAGTGGALLAWSAAAYIFRQATLQTSSFAQAYGGALGLAMRQQVAFKTGISTLGKVMFDVTKVQAMGNEVLRAGAYGQYNAQNMVGRQYGTLEEASTAMASRLGAASETMMKYTSAMGMSQADGAKLLVDMADGMAAMNVEADGSHKRLGDVINRFGQLNRMSGLTVPALTNMMRTITEITAPAGIAFDTVSAQTGMLMKTLREFGNVQATNNDLFLKGAGNMEKMTMALVQAGASITAVEATGYDLAMGLNTTKDPFRAILDNISKSPMEKLAAQLDTFTAKTGSTDKALVMMMQQGKIKPEMIHQLDDLMRSPGGAAALQAAAKMQGTPAEIQAKLSAQGYAPDMLDKLDTIAKFNAATKDPIEQLVDLTKSSVAMLANMVELSTRLFSKFGYQAPPDASKRVADAKKLSLGGGNN